MAGFDPDAYLSKKQGASFDPDAYLSKSAQSRASGAGIVDTIKQGAGDLIAGGVRGAGSIGATLLYPIDKATDLIKGDRGPNVTGLVTGKQPLSRNEERRQQMDEGLQSLGADTNSLAFKGGKLAGEIAGTAGVGGALANGVRMTAAVGGKAIPAAIEPLLNAIASSGMSTGGATAQGGKEVAKNLLTRAAGGAITGGASAGLVDPESAGAGAAIGAGTPVAIRGLGMAGRYAKNLMTVSPEVATLAEKAKSLGIDVPVDRLVNNKPLNALASSLEYLPFSGRAATNEKMASQLNTAVSKTFGQNSDNVTMALRKASDELGGKFDAVLKANAIKVNDGFLSKLADVEKNASDELVGDAAATIKKQVSNILEKAQAGQIDGQAAYNIKRTLDRIGKGQGGEAYHARELRDVLMDGLNDSLGADGAKAFAETRKQYGNMRTLEKIAQNGAEGDISIGRLANMRNIKNSDLQGLADISAQFLKTRENPHGALQRLVIGGAAVPTAAGLGGLPYLAGAAVAGRGVNSVLNSNMLRQSVIKSAGRPAQIGADESSALYNLLAKGAPVALSPSGNR